MVNIEGVEPTNLPMTTMLTKVWKTVRAAREKQALNQPLLCFFISNKARFILWDHDGIIGMNHKIDLRGCLALTFKPI